VSESVESCFLPRLHRPPREMGNSHGVPLLADQPSPTEKESLSIISGSFDDITPPVSGQAFLDECFSVLKRPVDNWAELVVKDCIVTEHGPDEYEVKVLMDGAKLKSYGFGGAREDVCDRVIWKRVKVDRATQTLVTRDLSPNGRMGEWADKVTGNEVFATCHMKVVNEPTRLEIWVIDKDGKRFSDMLKPMHYWVDRILNNINAVATAAVKVKSGLSIRDSGEVSVVSDPIDEHVSAWFSSVHDNTFDALLLLVRTRIERDTGPTAKVEEVSSAEFVVNTERTTPDGGVVAMRTRVSTEREKGEVLIDFDGMKEYFVLHKRMSVLERWAIDADGKRMGSTDAFVKETQLFVNELMTKVNSFTG